MLLNVIWREIVAYVVEVADEVVAGAAEHHHPPHRLAAAGQEVPNKLRFTIYVFPAALLVHISFGLANRTTVDRVIAQTHPVVPA